MVHGTSIACAHLGKPVSRCPYLNKTVKRAWRVTGKALVLVPKPKFSLAALRKDIERRFGVRIVVDPHECARTVTIQHEEE